MKNQENKLILSEDDFRVLKQFAEISSNNQNEMTLSHELNRAVVVKNDKLPKDNVSLNSQVRVRELGTNKEIEVCIVMPALADIKQRKISVLTPMGAALIGLREGETIEWKMPAGMKKFEVLEVKQADT